VRGPPRKRKRPGVAQSNAGPFTGRLQHFDGRILAAVVLFVNASGSRIFRSPIDSS
jgi:hypothetical protein